MSRMETTNLNYADEVVEFVEELLLRGAGQFAVAYHKPSKQWTVTYPPYIIGEDPEVEEE